MRKSSAASSTAARKSEKLDWANYNLLENLLIFCTVPDGNAPPESGVRFRITSQKGDKAVCLLFKIDRGDKDPLIKGDAIKPDYMAFYAESGKCICTIIELKGRTEKGHKHGIDQIKTFRDELRRHIDAHLPNKLRSRIVFQAILLSPINSDIPRKIIEKEHAGGFTILPLQYERKAELIDHVSKINKLNETPKIAPARKLPDRGFIEETLAGNALDVRRKDEFYNRRFVQKSRQGIYINYQLAGSSYAALFLTNGEKVLGIKENGSQMKNRLRALLSVLGVKGNSLEIETIV